MPTPAPSLIREVQVLPSAPRVFGRHEEFAGLWQAWEAARAGTGAFLLLRGAPGIGKSALAAKLANQVHVGGGATALVRCFRSEKSVPFAPVSAFVRQLARMPGFVALDALWIGELSRLAPELRERFPAAPAPMAIDDSARARLCDATLHAAESVCDEQPMLVVVDDLQDADEATLALLHYFGRMASGRPVLLLAIARTPSEAEFERSFVDTARSAGFVRTLELGALPGAEVRRIALQVLAQRGIDPVAEALDRLVAGASGNPLAAIELAMALPAGGGPEALAWLAGLPSGPGGATDAFEHTASERLAQLPADARAVAGALALAGRPLADFDLAAVTGMPTSTLASAILALDEAQFIRRVGAAVAFAHERYRASAEAAVPDEGRRRIHAALAAFLARSAATNPATRYEAAHHFAEAGRRRAARTQSLAAARFAASVGAVRERSAALELTRRMSGRYDGRLAADLGACLLDLKEFDRLDALCEEARRMPDLDPQLADEFRYLEIAADHHSGRAPLRRVQGALESLLASLRPGFPKLAAVRSLLMRTADKTGDHDAVRRVARAMRREPAPAGRARSAHALFASAYVIAKYYWPARALPMLEEASSLAQQEQDWELEHLCRDGQGTVLKHLGRYAESISAVQFGLALARKTLNPLAEASSLNNIANARMARGEFTLASGFLAQAMKFEVAFPKWPLRLYRSYNSAILALIQGDVEQAEWGLRRTLDAAIESDVWPIAVYSCGGLGVCSARRRDEERLREARDRLAHLAAGKLGRLPERWTVEATFAWSYVIEHGIDGEVSAAVRRVLAELRRRDIDSWLRLTLEWLRIREFAGNSVLALERQALAAQAEAHSAKAIESEVGHL